jgi:hypothetical protein
VLFCPVAVLLFFLSPLNASFAAVIDHEEFMVLEAPSRDTLEAASRVLNIGVAKAKTKLSALQSRPDADSAEKKHHETLLQQVRADRQERYLQQMGKSTK